MKKDQNSTRLHVGYVRVSTNQQADEGVSIAAQKAAIVKYAENNSIRLDEIFIDTGSGKNTDRKQFQNMLDKIENGQVKNLIIFKLDRLSRSVSDLANLANILQKNETSLHSVSEKIETESTMGRMFFNLLAVFAQFEREQTADRTKNALRHIKANGKRYCNKAPYGFVFVNDNLLRSEHEQDIIKEIRALKKTGLSYSALSTKLKEKGIVTREGQKFSVSLLHKICNPKEV